MESAPNPSNDLDIEEENIDTAPNPSEDPDIEISEEQNVESVQNPCVDPDNEIICRQDLDECISIREKSRRVNRRYPSQEIILEVGIEIDRLPESMRRKVLCNIWSTLRFMFEMIIKRAAEDLDPADLMRFGIFSPNLDKPISTCLWRVHTFTADNVLNTIANAIESNEELHLDETLRMEITTFRQPVGAGRIRKVVNVESDRLNKRSILCIPTDSLGLR
ncbi:hypothetical protein AVEN_64699-1 [Araneus ventricosus]|uniref:Uncharacterized protein n=1 Tax=Araneus ventricosus TaxID=182803 RepID=A0A4Y2Q5X6_ARAVE|nr:hypothetical protein AVEN_64699-1 [Araneus ventricosus]